MLFWNLRTGTEIADLPIRVPGRRQDQQLAGASAPGDPASGLRRISSPIAGLPDGLEPLLRAFLAAVSRTLAGPENEACAPFREMLLEHLLCGRVRISAGCWDQLRPQLRDLLHVRKPVHDYLEVKLFCLDPVDRSLKAALQRAAGPPCFFSATMTPAGLFSERIFGCDPDDASVKLAIPNRHFPAAHLQGPRCRRHVATTYKQRRESSADHGGRPHSIPSLRARTGNYLCFFPLLCLYDPDWRAVPKKSEETIQVVDPGAVKWMNAERARVPWIGLQRAKFHATLVGFAVMGGIFGEGASIWWAIASVRGRRRGGRPAGRVSGKGTDSPRISMKSGRRIRLSRIAIRVSTGCCRRPVRVIRTRSGSRRRLLLIDQRFADTRDYRRLLPVRLARSG